MMMFALLAAAATVPLPDGCHTGAYWDNKLPLEEMAMCQMGFFARYDELVKFRNIKPYGVAWVCGEIDKDMEGFQPFKYVDRNNWIIQGPTGAWGKFDGKFEQVGLYNEQITRARRKGDIAAVTALTMRREKFARAAREFLIACLP
jgi:hypothetical protein